LDDDLGGAKKLIGGRKNFRRTRGCNNAAVQRTKRQLFVGQM
jgi:hypothetical protein